MSAGQTIKIKNPPGGGFFKLYQKDLLFIRPDQRQIMKMKIE
jgi:hypothetical protein